MAGLKMNTPPIEFQECWSYLPVISECNVTVDDLFGEAVPHMIIIKEIAGNNVYWLDKGINTLTV